MITKRIILAKISALSTEMGKANDGKSFFSAKREKRKREHAFIRAGKKAGGRGKKSEKQERFPARRKRRVRNWTMKGKKWTMQEETGRKRKGGLYAGDGGGYNADEKENKCLLMTAEEGE